MEKTEIWKTPAQQKQRFPQVVATTSGPNNNLRSLQDAQISRSKRIGLATIASYRRSTVSKKIGRSYRHIRRRHTIGFFLRNRPVHIITACMAAISLVFLCTGSALDWFKISSSIVLYKYDASAESTIYSNELAVGHIDRSYTFTTFSECIHATLVAYNNTSTATQKFVAQDGDCKTIAYDSTNDARPRPHYIATLQKAMSIVLAFTILSIISSSFATIVVLIRTYENDILGTCGNACRHNSGAIGSTLLLATTILSSIGAFTFWGMIEQQLNTDPFIACNAEGLGKFVLPQAPKSSPFACRMPSTGTTAAAITTRVTATRESPAWLLLSAAIVTAVSATLLCLRRNEMVERRHRHSWIPRQNAYRSRQSFKNDATKTSFGKPGLQRYSINTFTKGQSRFTNSFRAQTVNNPMRSPQSQHKQTGPHQHLQT